MFDFLKLFRQRPHSVAPRLASVDELQSERFRSFMDQMNAFAAPLGLRTFTNWSKIWEYPWLWFHGMQDVIWTGKHVVDFGSEISPMPWWLATKGAKVVLIETDRQWEPTWSKLRDQLGIDIDWKYVTSDSLPLDTASADFVTSFSVIEHQSDKQKAADEIVRVLRPGGKFFISFDICEPSLGMTFPEWNGRALTLQEFEQLFWRNTAFGSKADFTWNLEAIPAFKAWHLQSAPHHNYVTGAAVLARSSS